MTDIITAHRGDRGRTGFGSPYESRFAAASDRRERLLVVTEVVR